MHESRLNVWECLQVSRFFYFSSMVRTDKEKYTRFSGGKKVYLSLREGSRGHKSTRENLEGDAQ